jgi:hypothetical protein
MQLETYQRCESLIQIKVVPPFHSSDIPEPHMRNFMTLNCSDTFFSLEITALGIEQENAGSACDQTPIFHGPCVKVADLGRE